MSNVYNIIMSERSQRPVNLTSVSVSNPELDVLRKPMRYDIIEIEHYLNCS
jgi:hypothetical protein